METKTEKMPFVPHVSALMEGTKAPDFEALNQRGEMIRLHDLKGKKVVLYFYPKDSTPGCTLQACNLNKHLDELTKAGFVVIGISPDSLKSHLRFTEKFNLKFHLLLDEEKKIIKAYDVWGKKRFMGRVFEGVIRNTFVIDEEGIISKIIRDVKTTNHANQIM